MLYTHSCSSDLQGRKREKYKTRPCGFFKHRRVTELSFWGGGLPRVLVPRTAPPQNSSLHASRGLLTGPWLMGQGSAGALVSASCSRGWASWCTCSLGCRISLPPPLSGLPARAICLCPLPASGVTPSVWCLQHDCWVSSCGRAGPQEDKCRDTRIRASHWASPESGRGGPASLGRVAKPKALLQKDMGTANACGRHVC